MIFANRKASTRQTVDGATVFSSENSSTPTTAKLELLKMLKGQAEKNIPKGTYMLSKKICAIVGGTCESSGRNLNCVITLIVNKYDKPFYLSGTKKRKYTGHASVVVSIMGDNKNKLQIKQFDPRDVNDAVIQQKVIQLARALNIGKVKLVPGSPKETSTDCLLASFKIIGRMLDGKFPKDDLKRTFDVKKKKFDADSPVVLRNMN